MAEWKSSFGGQVDPDAFRVDENVYSEPIFVGRAEHQGDLLPGKIVPSHGCCYVPYGGNEVRSEAHEYLKKPDYGRLTWVNAFNGEVPNGAIAGGHTANGETLYIGRVYYDNGYVPGKIHPTHQCLYFPYGGEEHHSKEYEALIIVYD